MAVPCEGGSTTLTMNLVNAMTGSATGASAQAALRPRLVAKSASASRSSTPKTLSMGGKNGRGGPGPDPNQVWNRNRGQ